jgi:CubicO group peptidase (beta-lactamase class C family)
VSDTVHSQVGGHVDPRFEPMRDAFAELRDPGAALAVEVDGEPVVDLWTGRGWERDTLVHVFSTTKPIAALCLLRLVDEGRLGLDDRVTSAWPEYGAAGKEATTVRQILAHQAGLNAFAEPQPLELLLDWDRCVAQIAAEPPCWTPGAKHGEQALLYGHLVGEVVRRVDGRSLGTYFREELAEPLGLDIHIGLDDETAKRAIDVEDPGGRWRAQLLEGADDLRRRAFENPPGLLDPAIVNSPAWRAAEIPAVNGHTTARSLARLYSALALGGELDGVRILSREMLEEALRVQAEGPDEVFGIPVSFGLGWRLDGGTFECADFAYGGIGGTVAYGNQSRRLAFAFVTRSLAWFDRAMAMERALLPLLQP